MCGFLSRAKSYPVYKALEVCGIAGAGIDPAFEKQLILHLAQNLNISRLTFRNSILLLWVCYRLNWPANQLSCM